jgi:hypothetical protein
MDSNTNYGVFDFRNNIVVGDWYSDGWCSPYVRGSFHCEAGDYLITASVWNPEQDTFAGNAIDLRCDVGLVASTGKLEPGEQRNISGRVYFPERRPAVALSLRSTIEWEPSPPDQRILGFVLISISIVSASDV